MLKLKQLESAVLSGEMLTREDALWLYHETPLGALAASAQRIRAISCGAEAELCTIVNAKSGRCSENCAFCAQSAHHRTNVEAYGLLDEAAILAEARYNDIRGVRRFSIVTAGRALSDDEVAQLCQTVRRLRRETHLGICVSAGLLSAAQFEALVEAGVTRIHNNLETSARFFPHLCTTHRFEDKIRAIQAAQAAGLEICSGGIFGVGETAEDRIDMAFVLRALAVDSVPLNVLHPIPGTPLAGRAPLDDDTMRRIVAVYRFILPHTPLRLAGGRALLADGGRGLLTSGANALITGDMLTTTGTTIEADRKMMQALGFEVRE